MIKIKNRCCYTVMLILCGILFLTGLTGCKSREAQFLIDGLQEAKAEVDAESSEEKTCRCLRSSCESGSFSAGSREPGVSGD